MDRIIPQIRNKLDKSKTANSDIITRRKSTKSLSRRRKSKSIRVNSITTPRTKEKAKVIENYAAQHPGDLELVIGQIVEVTKSKGAWWEGECDGKKGVFPARCVEKSS